MDKKKIAIIIVVAVGVIGAIGIFFYLNSSSCVYKSYIKAYNNNDIKKMRRLEYDYNEGNIINMYGEDTNTLEFSEITPIYKGSDKNQIRTYTSNIYKISNDNNSKISYVYVYKISKPGFRTQSLFTNDIITIGKVGLIYKVVVSPFYFPSTK